MNGRRVVQGMAYVVLAMQASYAVTVWAWPSGIERLQHAARIGDWYEQTPEQVELARWCSPLTTGPDGTVVINAGVDSARCQLLRAGDRYGSAAEIPVAEGGTCARATSRDCRLELGVPLLDSDTHVWEVWHRYPHFWRTLAFDVVNVALLLWGLCWGVLPALEPRPRVVVRRPADVPAGAGDVVLEGDVVQGPADVVVGVR